MDFQKFGITVIALVVALLFYDRYIRSTKTVVVSGEPKSIEQMLQEEGF